MMDSDLICPKCMKSFDDCKDYPAYHNRTRWICPHCGYDGDSIEFQTSYKWHPIHTITDNRDMKTGIELIAEERQRQIEKEGWTPEHDSVHPQDTMALAAVCYAMPSTLRKYVYNPSTKEHTPQYWPWNKDWWKPCPDDRIKELTKAGALIAAEIDRLLKNKTGA